MSYTKGNDGRGARSLLLRRLTTIFLALSCIAFGLFLLGVFEGETDEFQERHHRHEHHDEMNDGPPLPSHAEKRRRRQKRSILSMLGGSNHRGMLDVDLDDPAQFEPLLSSAVHLVDIVADFATMVDAPENTYEGVMAEFCHLDFSLHKKDPTSYPMFRHLVAASTECQTGKRYRVDLKDFTKLARAHDLKSNGEGVKALNLTGVVFHESRCGSTLVANALIAYNPTESRVFSESAPPIAALKTICGDDYQHCSLQQAAKILADTMYLMTRTNDMREKRVYFKIQSIGSRNIEVFQNALPQTPWIFVYRDPVQVMMSQLKMGAKYANCVRMRMRPNRLVDRLSTRKGLEVRELSDEQYCAAHLATITEAAVDAMQRSPHLGTPVNYNQLPDILFNDILPNKFGVSLNQREIDNIKTISGQYSKGTGGRQGEFKDDSEKKEQLATENVREATRMFLDESYAILEQGGIKKTKSHHHHHRSE